jgi:hypothetical protein
MVLAAPVLLLGTGAQASDLDGSCCMDLEARIAELEAATARKGNRRVSLTVSGYVTKQIMFWDDGADSSAYISDIGPTQATNFRMIGEAKIAPGWTAGYLMRIQDLSDNSMGLSQVVSRVDLGLNTQMSYWYLASKDLGKVSVGKNALASKSAAMFTDLSGTQVVANYVLFDGGQFFLRRDGQLLKLTWGDFGYCYSQARPWGGDCDGIVMEGVRYDSPTVGGFSFAASFGQDDDWELAGRYFGELAGFRIALGVGYSINTDERLQAQVSRHKRSEFFQAGGYLQHLATGLFIHAAYGEEDNRDNVILSGLTEPDTHQWYVKGGIRRQWSSLGHTVVYGEVAEYLDQLGPAALNAGATSSEFNRWGFGAVQEIDAASMSLWVKYRQHQVNITGPDLGGIEDFRYVSTGALINF